MKALVQIAKEQKLSPQAIHKRANKYKNQLKYHMNTDQRGKKYVNAIGERIILTGLTDMADINQLNFIDVVEVDIIANVNKKEIDGNQPQLPQPPIGERAILTGSTSIVDADITANINKKEAGDNQSQLHQPSQFFQLQSDQRQPQPHQLHQPSQCMTCPDKFFLQEQLRAKDQYIEDLLGSLKDFSDLLAYEKKRSQALFDLAFKEPQPENTLPQLPEIEPQPYQPYQLQQPTQLHQPTTKKKTIRQHISSLFV